MRERRREGKRERDQSLSRTIQSYNDIFFRKSVSAEGINGKNVGELKQLSLSLSLCTCSRIPNRCCCRHGHPDLRPATETIDITIIIAVSVIIIVDVFPVSDC